MSALLQIWRLLSPAQRRHCVWLQAVAIAMALSTVVGLAAVMPFFAVLGDPTLIERDAALHWLQQRLGSVGEREFLVALGCGFIGLLLVGSIINLFGSLAMSRFAYRIGDCFRIALFNEYLNRDFLFHARSGAAQLSSNVLYQSDRVTGMLQSGFVLITSVVMIVFIVLSMAIVDPVVSLTVLLVFGAGYSLVYRIARRRLLDGGRVQTQAGTERVAAVEQGFAGIKDLLVTQGQPVFASRFAAACETISRAASSTQMIGQFPRYLLECIAGTGLIVAALLLSARGPSGTWLAELTFIGFAGYRLLPAIQQAYFSIVTLRAHRAAFEHICADLAAALARPPVVPVTDPQWSGRPSTRVELVDVKFRYEKGAPQVVDGISLRIAAGSVVAFTGANGAGKTTTADLLLGILSPESGSIEIDGEPLTANNRQSWQQSLAYVPQQIYLLDASVRDNIALGVATGMVDQARLEQAAREAGAMEFIERLPRGFEEQLGNRGVRLSGGQRQRLGIARALYRSPSLLVLDEATSSLDEDSVQSVVAALQRLRGRCTVVVIAHHEAVIAACETAHQFEGGRIVASRLMEPAAARQPDVKPVRVAL